MSPIPVPSSNENQRLGKNAQKAEELTSTPYKDNLAVNKEKKRGKITDSNKDKNGKVQNKKSKTEKKVLKSQKKVISTSCESWYCVLCKEDKQEDMIQCMECRTWVHATCANVSPLRKIYFCPKCLLYDV